MRFGAQDDAARALQTRLRATTPLPFWQVTDLLPALERAVYGADVPNPELVLAIHETVHNVYRAEPARVADADGLRLAVLMGLGRMQTAREWTGRTWDVYPGITPGLMMTPVLLGYAPAGWLDGVSERIAATPYWQSTPIIRRRAEYWRGMIALTKGDFPAATAALQRAGAPPAPGATDDSVGRVLSSALRASEGWLRVMKGDSAGGMREVEAGLQIGGYDGEALVLNRPTRVWWTKTLAHLPERHAEGIDRIRGELVRAEGYHIAWWRLELARALEASGERDAAAVERQRFDALWSRADASAKAAVLVHRLGGDTAKIRRPRRY